MAENSGSTWWRGKRSKREKKWILVCSTSDKFENELGNGLTIERRSHYSRAEFHMVDLKNNKIQRYCFPSLVQFVITDSMVALDNFVYLFGALPSRPELESSDFKKLESESRATCQDIFLGGSRLDLDLDESPHKGWFRAPVLSENASFSKCTSLLGKIYTFGCYFLNPEVLDPVDGNWKSICSRPDELVGCSVSTHAVPDPSNKRLFVHLCDGKLSSPSLFAFYPPSLHPDDVDSTGIWECIACDFHDWNHIALVFDGVIYFHRHKFETVLRAFDIATGKWLKVHWVSRFDGKRDFNNTRMKFDALFLLADRVMCLAVWSRTCVSADHSDAKIYFYKFKVVEKGESIKLRPLVTRSYDLPGTSRVQAFLPV